ncbi:unnamed protein product, partial [marine sediment metagenome]
EIVHKFVHGYVDLQFAGMGSRLNKLRSFFEPHLSIDMSIVPAAKSAVIRTFAPALNSADDFDSQIVEVETGIDIASGYLKWFVPLAEHWTDWKVNVENESQQEV